MAIFPPRGFKLRSHPSPCLTSTPSPVSASAPRRALSSFFQISASSPSAPESRPYAPLAPARLPPCSSIPIRLRNTSQNVSVSSRNQASPSRFTPSCPHFDLPLTFHSQRCSKSRRLTLLCISTQDLSSGYGTNIGMYLSAQCSGSL
jgi:hypothetical protein